MKYVKEGKYSKQAHADLPENSYEREIGHEGFFGPVTHIYHKHPPVLWEEFSGPLRPCLFNLSKLNLDHKMPFEAVKVLYNNHVNIKYFFLNKSMPYLYRNSDGDEVLFIHNGLAHLFCDFGHMMIKKGDYVLIPRGCMWRLEVKEPLEILCIEAKNEHFRLPEKGLLGINAIFDQEILEHPLLNDQFYAPENQKITEIKVKRLDEISYLKYPFNPLDAIGYKGTVCVFRINVNDIRPIMSHRYHVPPSAHTTFLSKRLVVCTFAPRPIESDPGVLKVPFFHNNDDFEEVLFYHDGNFFSRDNIDKGMMTYHPFGFTHGPHPKAYERSLKDPKSFTDEVAVMIDTRDALKVGEEILAVEDKSYINSWKKNS